MHTIATNLSGNRTMEGTARHRADALPMSRKPEIRSAAHRKPCSNRGSRPSNTPSEPIRSHSAFGGTRKFPNASRAYAHASHSPRNQPNGENPPIITQRASEAPPACGCRRHAASPLPGQPPERHRRPEGAEQTASQEGDADRATPKTGGRAIHTTARNGPIKKNEIQQ